MATCAKTPACLSLWLLLGCIGRVAQGKFGGPNQTSAKTASGCNGNVCWPYSDFDCDSDSDCLAHGSMRDIGAVRCGNANCPWSSWGSRDDCCEKVQPECQGEVCWPYHGFDCDSDHDCGRLASMQALGATVCGDGNCPWSSWGSKDDCCVKRQAACEGDVCWPYRGFDCDSDSDCAGDSSMAQLGATMCGNNNCPWPGDDDCCFKAPVECGCKGGGCWPRHNFDCDTDADCKDNAQMAALGATVCGNANCPWDSWGSTDDCCIRTACTGENFEHPAETFMGITPGPTIRVVGDLDTVWMKVTKLSLLTGPTDGFGDIFGLNRHDEVTFRAWCPDGSAQTPQREFAACDQRRNIMRLGCGVPELADSDGIHMEVKEWDTSEHEVKTQLLDIEALLGMPVGSKTRVRFYLNNEQNIFDSALLGLTEIGFFEFCVSDVLSLVPGGAVASGAVRAAKAAKLSAKAVRRIAAAARRIRSGQRHIERMQRRYEQVQGRMEAAQNALIVASEMRDLDEPDFDPVEIPSWPTLDTVLEAFDIIPCVDFAEGAIYRYTVYEAELVLGDDASLGDEAFVSGAADSGGDATCPAGKAPVASEEGGGAAGAPGAAAPAHGALPAAAAPGAADAARDVFYP